MIKGDDKFKTVSSSHLMIDLNKRTPFDEESSFNTFCQYNITMVFRYTFSPLL